MVTMDQEFCPDCGGILRYHDRVKRIVRTSFGRSYWIYISRKICTECGKKHRELPDTLLPYKHYEITIIEGFISGKLSSEDLEYEDYPCETTIRSWRSPTSV